LEIVRVFHAMLWWGRALMDWVEGRWGERVKGEIVDHPQLLQQSLFAHQRKPRNCCRLVGRF
jgi:hypothetical protein